MLTKLDCMPTHVLFVAPQAPYEEPTATLTYGEDTFEIPLTMLGWIAGWISMGAHDFSSPALADNVIAAFRHVQGRMNYDAMRPADQKACHDYAARFGTTPPLTPFVLPRPEYTVYAKGHIPLKLPRPDLE